MNAPGWEGRGGGPPGSEEESGPGFPPFLFDPIGVVRRRWPWILVAGLLGLVATSVAVSVWKPVYVAESSVLITSQQIPENFVRSTVRENTLENINAMVGEVFSQAKLSKLMERLDLYPERREAAGMASAIGLLRSKTEIGPTASQRRGSRGDTALVYSIAFEHGNPEVAAAVANELAALFVEASLERRIEQASRATGFLKQELARDQLDLQKQSRRVREIRQANRGRLPEELGANLQKLEMLSNERTGLTTRIAQVKNRIAQLSSTPQEVAEPSEAERTLDALRQSLVDQLAAHTDEHPNVLALRRRIKAQEQRVAEGAAGQAPPGSAIAVMIQAERGEQRILEERLATIDQEYAELNARVDETPALTDQLAALEQDLVVMREDYLDTLRKVEEAELAENMESAQQGGQVNVLDRAQVPNAPKRPRWRVAAISMAATVLLALGIAFLLEQVDPVVVGISQLESITDRPVIGSIPHMS